jgi:hypothetical protein
MTTQRQLNGDLSSRFFFSLHQKFEIFFFCFSLFDLVFQPMVLGGYYSIILHCLIVL